jgi:hypothetical protein
MDRKQVAQRVTALNLNDVKASDAFIRELRDGSMEAPRALVELWSAKTATDKATRLIPDLEDLSIRPLLELPTDKLTPIEQAWLLSTTTDAVAALRDLLVRRLAKLLGDVRPLPQPHIPGSEEQPLPRRVCDVAYLAMRKILFFEEDPAAAVMNGRAYLSQPEVKRDIEINTFKRTKAFTRFVKD